jgi:hypothetical protein
MKAIWTTYYFQGRHDLLLVVVVDVGRGLNEFRTWLVCLYTRRVKLEIIGRKIIFDDCNLQAAHESTQHPTLCSLFFIPIAAGWRCPHSFIGLPHKNVPLFLLAVFTQKWFHNFILFYYMIPFGSFYFANCNNLLNSTLYNDLNLGFELHVLDILIWMNMQLRSR